MTGAAITFGSVRIRSQEGCFHAQRTAAGHPHSAPPASVRAVACMEARTLVMVTFEETIARPRAGQRRVQAVPAPHMDAQMAQAEQSAATPSCEPPVFEVDRAIRGRSPDSDRGSDHERPFAMELPEHRQDLRARRRVQMPVGSSASRRTGSLINARAMATRCISPPEALQAGA